MSGLGHDYDPVVVLLSSQHKSVSLQDAQYMLMVHEQRIDQLNSASQVEISNVASNYASNSKSNNFRGGYSSNNRGGNNRRGRGRGRSGRWHSNNRLSCQVCGKNGHSALQCYRRFDQTFMVSINTTVLEINKILDRINMALLSNPVTTVSTPFNSNLKHISTPTAQLTFLLPKVCKILHGTWIVVPPTILHLALVTSPFDQIIMEMKSSQLAMENSSLLHI
ncbi:hypothetical protein ACOSP7_021924 [Xanthoceras sorbifolium]